MSRPVTARAAASAIADAGLGQVEAGQPAVEDAVRVVDLTVAQQVDDGACSVTGLLRADRGRGGRRGGSASATWPIAASSWAAETNHASYALGGR